MQGPPMRRRPGLRGRRRVPGTGNYAIGTDIPYGGFEFADGVLEQPAGCTGPSLTRTVLLS